MKIIILYSHPRPPSYVDYFDVIPVPGDIRGRLFVRAESVECEGEDALSDALDLAKPRPGETVLNTVRHPSEVK